MKDRKDFARYIEGLDRWGSAARIKHYRRFGIPGIPIFVIICWGDRGPLAAKEHREERIRRAEARRPRRKTSQDMTIRAGAEFEITDDW